MKRILLAGLVGGLVVFVWGAASHMLLPVGEMGLKSMPVNSPLPETMRANLADDGLYFFPGREVGRKQTEAEDAVWMTKYKMGPTGLLLYHRSGNSPMSPRLLGVELATDIAGALLLAYLLTQLSAGGAGIGSQMRISMLAGIFAWVSISVPYWNWYGFPCAFILAELIDQVVGWTLAGLFMALLWRRLERRAMLQAERIWES